MHMPRIFEMSEETLLRFICGEVSTYLNAFSFMEEPALGLRRAEWTIDCYITLPRTELGLVPDKKPGDIDVLLVPTFDGDRFCERAMAIEAKRFVVPRCNRGRSPNEYGTDQINGLCSDGFPLVGLLHVALVEDSADDDLVEIPVLKMKYAISESPFEGTTQIDPAHFNTTKRHVGRIEGLQLPEYVGYNVETLQIDKTGSRVVGWSVWGWKAPKVNPARDAALVERLRNLKRPPHYRINHTFGGVHISSTGAYRD